MVAENQVNIIKADCPCPKLKCERHANCEACEAYHGRKGTRTFCKREKAKAETRIKRK